MGKRIEKRKGEYYVYVYLDPRKLGRYVYGDYKFLHEPIYVGKGKRKRAYYFENRNYVLRLKLEEIGKPIILIITKQLTESESLSLEKKLIASIGRKDLVTGPLCNLSEGGKGSSGYKLTEETKGRMSKAQKLQKPSEETKKKISKSLQGRVNGPRPKEIKRKISKTLEGRTPWNKGKTAWNKGRIGISEKTRTKMAKARTNYWLKKKAIIAAKESFQMPLLE